jgi:mannose-6-phosphate isomerase-like protein (cupin superfamily)
MTETAPQVVLPCDQLETTIDWFAAAGFRMLLLRPADDPSVALLEGHGLTLRLDSAAPSADITLRIPVEHVPTPPTQTAPNGTVLLFVPSTQPDSLPLNDPAFVHDRHVESTAGRGRAGMHYRDLIPDRQGGRWIASHISIPVGGPVADYVHHHHIRFQMIFCHAGWADLVYEDQGEPFRFEAGDCVLQPPHIRHQVLRTSDDFDVVEVSSPAEHDTLRDHELTLPTGVIDARRDFNGQRFAWHRASTATWLPWHTAGFTASDFDFETSTNGLAQVCVVRSSPGASLIDHVAAGEFTLWFVRSGTGTLRRNGESHPICELDSLVLVEGERYDLTDLSDGFEFLEVRATHP